MEKKTAIIFVSDYLDTITIDSWNHKTENYKLDKLEHFKLLSKLKGLSGVDEIVYSICSSCYKISEIQRIVDEFKILSKEYNINFNTVLLNENTVNIKTNEQKPNCGLGKDGIVFEYLSGVYEQYFVKGVIVADDRHAYSIKDYYSEKANRELDSLFITFRPKAEFDYFDGEDIQSTKCAIAGTNACLRSVVDKVEKHKGAFNKSIFK